MARNAQRTRCLQPDGIEVLRFSDRDILLETEGVLEVIARAVTEGASPYPLPGVSAHGSRGSLAAPCQADRPRDLRIGTYLL